jgi:EAL domain-containing protein (putative c-di-GMP-specific phosphodiesterase class I)
MVFQPIVRLRDRQPVGYEALARFPSLEQGPGEVFADAWRLGVGVELEMTAVRAALAAFPQVPSDAYMSINAAPATLASWDFREAVGSTDLDPTRLVVEVTEHAAIDDYEDLLAAVTWLAGLGVRLAIDDVGMGFSGLNQILRLSPHIIKVDAGLVRDIDESVAKQALISALVTFGARTAATVVAEGVETSDEWDALRILGVEHAQGYHVSRPANLTEFVSASPR